MQTLIVRIRRAMLSREAAARTDAELLDAFIQTRDDAAFAALVRRHGPMVLGVCRRILGRPHDAEDAFQATYLVLARKAASVRPREMVANWLHGVARRVALRARTLAAKRHTRERQVAAMPEPKAPSQDLWHDLRPIIDEELARLPDIYRLPILLCDLEGKSIKEAMGQLGWPQGTVAGRLARGRKQLAARLTRRGVALSGSAVAATLVQHASATVPDVLIETTAASAVSFAAGSMGSAALPATVLALAKGAINMMVVSQLKVPTMVIAVTAAALSAWMLWDASAAQPPPNAQVASQAPPPAAPKAAPGPRPAPEPAWKADFRKAYGLKPGEHVKRIAPPYPASRTDYFKDRFQRDAADRIPFDEHFTVISWRDNWAPPELARHTLPVKPNDGVALSRLLDMTAGLSRAQVRGLDDVLSLPVTGDFVVRAESKPEQIIPQLQTVLEKECGVKVAMQFREVEEEVFVLSGRYQPKPLEGRKDHQFEIYAEHLTDRQTGGGGSGTFDRLLEHVERHINRRVLAGKIDGLPKRLSWHFNVRSPMLIDPIRGIDTHAEDTNPLRVLGNIAAQTGLKLDAETRSVRILDVARVGPNP
jgi:RNA polymerase sigma factor (sigma-70 family)